MQNGEIQQIGTPTDIYNEPENRFVANFIGESNIIEGIMVDDYKVRFDKQEFECVDYGFIENEEVDVVIRPEDIDIVKPEMGKMLGVIQSILFKGVHFEIVVKTQEREWIVHTTDKSDVGAQVGLHFFPEDIHIMYRMGSY